MKKIILSFLVLFIFLIPSLSKAQCGFDVVREKQLLDPAFVLQEQANELKIKNFIPPTNVTGKAGSVLTIPVVVHVLHKGEAVGSGTNISDAQIQSAIDRLNEVYRGLDPNSPIDFEIEFSLAQRDPNCNVTNGINRVLATGVAGYSANGVFMQSVGADENELKDLSKWPETDYCNIWIVSEIDNNGGGAGIQGYANFFNGNTYEGSVMMASVFGYDPGNTNGWGLNSSGDGGTVVHEFGHYFHLYHTFQGDNDDTTCPGDAVVGTDSDGCADTETHKRHTSTCPTNNDCNSNNPYGLNTRNNYMSYFSCTDRLTSDQKTRVVAAMTGTSIVASKGSLPPDPGYAAPVAVCATNSVSTSNAGITSVELNGTTFNSFSSSSDGGNIDNSGSCSVFFEIDASTSNTLNVGMYTVNFQQLGVWIDWNDDGDFDDEAEQQHLSQDIAANATVPIILSYPASIPYDDYVRIRLITDLDDRYGPGIINSSCYSSIQFGQSEDYTIYVQPASGSAPVADFSASSTSVCLSNSITFTDSSTESPTSWLWNFGDGNSSTLQNPTHVYASAGTYTVTLTATNASGSDDEVKTNHITVNANPDLSSTSSSDETCTGNDGTATVTPSPVGSYTYSWNTAPAQTNATATGLSAATYNVTVTNTVTTCFASTDVVVANGCLGAAPIADFNASSTSVCIGESVSFTDASTQSPTAWFWDFGDGITSNAQNPSHAFLSAGTYTITLTATNASGSDDTVSIDLITIKASPVISISSTNETCAKNDGTASASGGGSYSWNTIPAQNTAIASGLAEGNYTVTVTTNGCSAEESVMVNADNCVPNTEIRSEFCGLTLTNITDEIRAYSVSGANEYQYRLTESGVGTVLTYSYPVYKLKLAWVTGIKYQTTYSIEVRARIGSEWGVYSNLCNITTPIMPVPNVTSGQCGGVLNSLTEIIYFNNVNKATNYEYSLTEQGTSNTYTYNNGIYRVKAAWFGSEIKYNTTYELKARAFLNGIWSEYGNICEITTPIMPVPNVTSGQCGGVLNSLTEIIYFNNVNKATNYEYSLTEQGTSNTYTYNNGIYRVKAAWFGSEIKYNTTYELKARAYVNGDWSDYGNVCEITTPAGAIVAGDVAARLANNNEVEEEIVSTSITIYPNPNQGEYLYVELSDLGKDAELIVMDVYGKQIHKEFLITEESNYNTTVRFDQKLTSGFYLVTVNSNGKSITKKLIVR